MLSGKGEWVYSSSEIGRLINIHPSTICAASARLFGSRKYEWTLEEAVMLKKYMEKTSREEYAAHMAALAIALGVEQPAEEDDAL